MLNIKEFYYEDKDFQRELIAENEMAMHKLMDHYRMREPIERSQLVQKMSNKINLSKISISHKEINSINYKQKNIAKQRYRIKDKSDRATVEQVLDPKTRVILCKMIKNEMITKVNGCVSTGKEANVYHAFTPNGEEYAIKIFKTSILIFKDREKYIEGERRFRRAPSRCNPRKLIKVWCEKELRNLKRIFQSEIPCPEPILVKTNILIMQFIGKDMCPIPRLKDTTLETQEYCDIYQKCLSYMRVLYQECKLVHGDLSEYNMLYDSEKSILYYIDVSQSIEHDHPNSLLFLKRDIINVNNYFSRQKVQVLRPQHIFIYITDNKMKKSREADALDDLFKNQTYLTEEERQEDSMFKDSYIPQRLDEMDEEKIIWELDNLKKNGKPLYAQMAGLKLENDIISEVQSEMYSDQEDDVEDSDDEDKKPHGWQKYSELSKADRKKKVKEENRLRRKNKTSKKRKKQLLKKRARK